MIQGQETNDVSERPLCGIGIKAIFVSILLFSVVVGSLYCFGMGLVCLAMDWFDFCGSEDGATAMVVVAVLVDLLLGFALLLRKCLAEC